MASEPVTYFELKIPDDDDGHSLGRKKIAAPTLPRRGDTFMVFGKEATGKPGYDGYPLTAKVVDVVWTVGLDDEDPEAVPEVWVVEEHAAFSPYCTCTDEQRAKINAARVDRGDFPYDEDDIRCFNCGHKRS